MTSPNTTFSARFRSLFPQSSQTMAMFALAGLAMVGCAGGPGVGEDGFDDEVAQSEPEVASTEAALRIGSGPRLGYTCKDGTCTCDKSIENDCEDMSGVCRDADIDGLINCINGWLTTHCTCKTALVKPKGGLTYTPPAGGVMALKAF